MTAIQAILVALSLVAAILAGVAGGPRLGLRLFAVLFFVVAVAFIARPNSTTVLAHALGVGRGTDLLFYFSILAGIDAILLLYLRIRRLEKKLTAHIRAVAIATSESFGASQETLT